MQTVSTSRTRSLQKASGPYMHGKYDAPLIGIDLSLERHACHRCARPKTQLNQTPLGHRLVIAFPIAPNTHYSQWKAVNINIVSDHGLRPQSVCGRKPAKTHPIKLGRRFSVAYGGPAAPANLSFSTRDRLGNARASCQSTREPYRAPTRSGPSWGCGTSEAARLPSSCSEQRGQRA